MNSQQKRRKYRKYRRKSVYASKYPSFLCLKLSVIPNMLQDYHCREQQTTKIKFNVCTIKSVK